MVKARKRYVFLGASGRIGRLLRAPALAEEWSGIHLDWQVRDEAADGWMWRDFSDPEPLAALARDAGGIDGLFCFVGLAGRAKKNDATAMMPEVDLMRAVRRAATAAGIGRVIVASSSAVYGAGADAPMSEATFPTNPNAYGAMKLLAEGVWEDTEDAVALRLGNVAGADALLGALGNAPPVLDIFPDGRGPVRSYITPRHLARVLVALAGADNSLPRVLNVAADAPVSMDALLDAAGLEFVKRPCAAGPHQTITLDCSALRDLIGDLAGNGSADEIVAGWREARS